MVSAAHTLREKCSDNQAREIHRIRLRGGATCGNVMQ